MPFFWDIGGNPCLCKLITKPFTEYVFIESMTRDPSQKF